MKKKKNINTFFIILLLLLLVIVCFNAARSILYPVKYREIVVEYSNKYNLDPNLIFAMIKAESGFDKDAVSAKNARGLMQITDRTGRWGADVLEIKDYVDESLYDPEINILIGCWYISKLLEEFGNDLELALAAYNAGSGNVARWLSDGSISSDGTALKSVPFKETENYIKKVKKFRKIYDDIYGNGF